jgi:hypothetical protein
MFLVLVVEPVQKCIDVAIPLKTESLNPKNGCGRTCGKEQTDLTDLQNALTKRATLSESSSINVSVGVEKGRKIILNQQLDC